MGTRLIPLEPMYVILNLGMSEAFGAIEYDALPFPSHMKVDWVRCGAGGARSVGAPAAQQPTQAHSLPCA